MDYTTESLAKTPEGIFLLIQEERSNLEQRKLIARERVLHLRERFFESLGLSEDDLIRDTDGYEARFSLEHSTIHHHAGRLFVAIYGVPDGDYRAKQIAFIPMEAVDWVKASKVS